MDEAGPPDKIHGAAPHWPPSTPPLYQITLQNILRVRGQEQR